MRRNVKSELPFEPFSVEFALSVGIAVVQMLSTFTIRIDPRSTSGITGVMVEHQSRKLKHTLNDSCCYVQTVT